MVRKGGLEPPRVLPHQIVNLIGEVAFAGSDDSCSATTCFIDSNNRRSMLVIVKDRNTDVL